MEKYKWLHQIGYIKLHINGYIQMVTNKRQQKVLVVARVYLWQHRCKLIQAEPCVNRLKELLWKCITYMITVHEQENIQYIKAAQDDDA